MAERPETQSETTSSDRSSSQYSLSDQSQAPISEGLKSRQGNIPIMYPTLVPGLFPPQLEQDQMNRGPGLYAVPVPPFGQPVTGFPADYLIPFTYNLPTTASGHREVAGEQGGQQQEAGPQRQVVVRRFEIAIHIDLLLILKLVAVIFLFNHDGSKQRLALLVVLASLVYLHQTGALAPLIRWLSQRTQRAAGVGPRADNLPAADAARVNENVGFAGAHPVGVNENQQVNDGNTAAENENAEVPEQVQAANRWWGIVKEIQLIATAFVTSLLPGFNNLD